MSPTSGIAAMPSRTRSRERSHTSRRTAWPPPSRHAPSSWTGRPGPRRIPSPRVARPPPRRSRRERASTSPSRDLPIRLRVAGRRHRPGRPSRWGRSTNQRTRHIATLAWAAKSRRWMRPSGLSRPSRRSRLRLPSWPGARESANLWAAGQLPSRRTGTPFRPRCLRGHRPVRLGSAGRRAPRRPAARRTRPSGASHGDMRRIQRSLRG